MRQMPCSTVAALIHPQLLPAGLETLVRGPQRLNLGLIHDLVGSRAALRSEEMHGVILRRVR